MARLFPPLRGAWLPRLELGCGLTFLFLWALEYWGAAWWPVALLICLPHLPSGLPLVLLTYVRLRVDFRGCGWLLAAWAVWLAATGLAVHWPGRGPLRVASFNVEGCPEGAPAIGKRLRGLSADLYALQEVNGWELREPDFWPGPRERWHYANDGEFLVFSRYPILASRLVEVQKTAFQRPVQVVDLQLPGNRPLRVINTHLSLLVHGPQWIYEHRRNLPEHIRKAQEQRSGQVAGLLREVRGSTLVVGDFNGQPRDRSLRPLHARLADSFAERGQGWGFTFEATLPLIRIDYMWHTPDLVCHGAWSQAGMGSDHKPVWGEFSLFSDPSPSLRR